MKKLKKMKKVSFQVYSFRRYLAKDYPADLIDFIIHSFNRNHHPLCGFVHPKNEGKKAELSAKLCEAYTELVRLRDANKNIAQLAVRILTTYTSGEGLNFRTETLSRQISSNSRFLDVVRAKFGERSSEEEYATLVNWFVCDVFFGRFDHKSHSIFWERAFELQGLKDLTRLEYMNDD